VTVENKVFFVFESTWNASSTWKLLEVKWVPQK